MSLRSTGGIGYSRKTLVLIGATLLSLAALFLLFPGQQQGEITETILTPEEREWLDDNPDKLILYYNTDFPPIEFAGEDGSFTGLGADVISSVEERLGIHFIKQPCEDWNRHLQALADGDCAVAPTIVRTDAREEYAFFTVPYARVPVVIITARSITGTLELEELDGLHVAVVSGYATEGYLHQAGGDSLDIIPMWNVPEALQAVAFGEVDAFVENLAVAAWYTESEGLSNLRVAGVTDFFFEWSIGVSRKYPLLFSAVQKALADIPRSELESMHDKWISMQIHRRLSPELLHFLRIAALFVAALLVSLTIVTLYLKGRLNEKVSSLEIAQKELLEQSARLLHAEKMEALGTLAGGIAHDFNNILQVIGGYAQLLLARKDAADPDRDELERIAGAGRRAASLINQLMAFSRNIETKRVPVDINREVENSAAILKQTIPRMVEITLNLEANLPRVSADPVHLEQMIFNLAGNSVDAMPDGGELLLATSGTVLENEICRETGAVLSGSFVVLSVSDTGSGMSSSVMEKIYDPFFTTKEPGKGTGLGLASVYGIVSTLGGCIKCTSREGAGTRFSIFLPTCSEDNLIVSPGQKAPDQLPGNGETVLVVDDEPHITDQTREYLQMLGYSVYTADTGEQALEVFSSLGRVDIVLLDLNMPGMGGYRCLQELLRLDPSVKVLIVSGHSEFDLNRDQLTEGARGFVRKPYRLADLAGRIREVLS